MSSTTTERPLPPLAAEIKKILRKTPQTPDELAQRVGRKNARGMGRAFTALVERDIAERTAEGSYKKKEG